MHKAAKISRMLSHAFTCFRASPPLVIDPGVSSLMTHTKVWICTCFCKFPVGSHSVNYLAVFTDIEFGEGYFIS